jgi:two-component system OmpR family sensor kinase
MKWRAADWRKWGLALVPAAMGLLIAALAMALSVDVPILMVRVDLGILAAICGVTLSLLLVAGLALRERVNSRCQRQIAQVRSQLAEERRRFLRRLDHEFKNPLTAIHAGLANAANGSTSEARQEALASVEAQVMRLSQLTADLRKLAELEKRPLELAPVDIAELLQEAMDLALEQPEAEARHLRLILPQAPWPVPQVPGDRDLLFLAIYNLLDNALKFTRPGDTVEVRAVDERAEVVITVADTGPGISDEELPRVWEELYRGQGAQGVPGSGLGLALVRAVAERHDGQVTLRSRAGQGTVVTLRLPVS